MKFVTINYSDFFDRPKVVNAVDRRNRRVLSGTGAWARRYVQQSMRRGGKDRAGRQENAYFDATGRRRSAKSGRFVSTRGVSRPGEPPRWHEKLLRRFILFAYEADTKSVVVGPKLLDTGRPQKGERFLGAKTVPELLEKGGGKIVRSSRRRANRIAKPERYTYRPRPFIEPAVTPAARKMREIMEKTPLSG